jgi:hypothetical protein
MTFPLARPDSIRRKFTPEEDDLLRRLVLQFGDHDWATVGRHMPARDSRQCRHRYNNYLIGSHKELPWTAWEENLIIAKYNDFGPKWVTIATFLPGRTGNDVKNRWHKHISKQQLEGSGQNNSAGIQSMCPAHGCFGARSERDGAPIGASGIALSPFLQFVLN